MAEDLKNINKSVEEFFKSYNDLNRKHSHSDLVNYLLQKHNYSIVESYIESFVEEQGKINPKFNEISFNEFKKFKNNINLDINVSNNSYLKNYFDQPTNVVDDVITKQVLVDAIDEAFDELEGLRLAGELPGGATHGLFTRELLNVLEAKGFDINNPENIKRLDNWALNSGFSDVKSFSDLIIADVKEPTLVQSAFPGKNFDNDLNIIRTAQPTDTIFIDNITKDVIKNEIFNNRSSLDKNTIEYIKKNTDTPTNVVDNLTELENNIRSKYSDYLQKDRIRGYYAEPGSMSADIPEYISRGISLSYSEGDISREFPYNKNTLFITNLYIDETQRGQGIGSQIFDEIKQFADDNGLYIRLLNDENFNTTFWEKKGFGIYETPRNPDRSWERTLPNYVLAPEGETLPVTPNRLDTPGGSLGAAQLNDPLVFDSWVDNLGRTTASFVDNLPLQTVVKNRVKNLITTKTKQLAKPGSLLVKAVDAWEFAVIGLMAAGVAFNEIDEVPTIINNTTIDMFNSMTTPYGIPPVAKEEYDIDYEFINTVLDTGTKVMPTDIIIEKLKPYSLEKGEDVILPGTGVTATTGAEQQFEPYGEELAEGAEKTVNIKRDEVKQKLLESKGVQEEKMFEQAKPKKSSGAGSGVKIL